MNTANYIGGFYNIMKSKDYELYLESILGLLVINKEKKVVYMNQQCADHINVNIEKSIGKDIRQVFPPTIMPQFLEGNQKFNTNFYLHEGRLSVSSQIQLRENDEIVGVLEYDMLQGIESLDDLLLKYAGSISQETEFYREAVRKFKNTTYSINNIIGNSKVITDLKRQIEFAANTNSTVLITGETGVGKELVVHAIHNLSRRSFQKFMKVNSAGIPLNLAESELFGYEEGSFTGAKKGGNKGVFEIADGGTLFIDEINQMPIELQPKLLRVLQDGEVTRIGGHKSIQTNVRVIASTNQSLVELVAAKKFKEDLFYRLNVFPIEVPPLRERLEDIPELVTNRMEQLNDILGKKIEKIDPEVFSYLQSKEWPGNIRELYNVLERAMNYAEGSELTIDEFNMGVNFDEDMEKSLLLYSENPIEDLKRETEKRFIKNTLKRFNGNKTEAAKYLHIARSQLYAKIKRLKIDC